MASVECLIGETNARILDDHQVAGGDNSLPSQPAPPVTTDQIRRLAMTYGLSTRAFIEDGPVEQVAKAGKLRTTARSWRALSEACRLEVVERAVRAANDPLAL